MVEFKEWPKIPRGAGETITITEKIDGTNACVIVQPVKVDNTDGTTSFTLSVVGVQSRNRMLATKTPEGIWDQPGDDNYGFAYWVRNNEEELIKLGEGYHYGEWAGEGIQKNHHNIVGKKLFLFNSDRWRDGRQERPAGVECVPILYEGPTVWTSETGQPTNAVDWAMNALWINAKEKGYHPEGIVVWYHKTRRYEKYTFENANGKWANGN